MGRGRPVYLGVFSSAGCTRHFAGCFRQRAPPLGNILGVGAPLWSPRAPKRVVVQAPFQGWAAELLARSASFNLLNYLKTEIMT